MCVCVCVCVYLYTYMRTLVYMHVSVCMYIYVLSYMCTHTHRQVEIENVTKDEEVRRLRLSVADLEAASVALKRINQKLDIQVSFLIDIGLFPHICRFLFS